MRPWIFKFLRCPRTGSLLKLRNPKFDGPHIMKGSLVSTEGRIYPIIQGVPRLTLDYQTAEERKTVLAFNNEWRIFNKSNGYMGSRGLFFDFVRGIAPSDFMNKTVLEAGCGNGRWIKIMSLLGCKYVIGMDFSSSVDFCFQNTKDIENVTIVQGSIYNPPFAKKAFDIVLSIGVIDHLFNPKEGLRCLKDFVAENGKLSFWIYGYEGNELYLKIALPLRAITTKIPKTLLLPFVVTLSIPVWGYCHSINTLFGLNNNDLKRFPMAHYFIFLRQFSFWDVVNIVYDQLAPQLAFYIKREELLNWIEELKLEPLHIFFRNNNSYSVITKIRQ